MMNTIVVLAGSFLAFLFAAAIISRLASDKQVPGLVGKGTDAMANIFRGVFRG